MWPFRRRLAPPDLDAFFADLAASHPGKRYTKTDRYRDFRHVFLQSERGKRVLFELLTWGHMYRSPAKIANFNTNETFFHDGEAHFAKMIMSTIHAEPKDRPVSTKEIK